MLKRRKDSNGEENSFWNDADTAVNRQGNMDVFWKMKRISHFFSVFLIVSLLLTILTLQVSGNFLSIPEVEAIQSKKSGLFWWDTVVEDAKRGWDALLDLRNDFNPCYGNLTHRYYKIGLNNSKCPEGTNVTTYHLYPDLLPASLAMYKLTGNLTYLEYAEDTCDDMENYMMQADGQVCYFANSTGAIDTTQATELTLRYLTPVSWLASIDSNYETTLTNMCNYVLENHIDASTKFVYFSMYPDNLNGSDISGIYGVMQEFANGMMYAYLTTQNSSYLDAVYDFIKANWDERNQTTNLMWDRLQADNPSSHYDSYTRQYSSGGWIRTLAMYYYITGNTTVKDILQNFSKACCNHIWDGDNWDYQTYVETGGASSDIIEGNWASLDYGMLEAYEITGNRTFLDYAKESHNTSFNDEGYGVHTAFDLVSHGSSDGGALCEDESATNFAFSMINLVGQYLGHNENSSDYWDQLYILYKNTLLKAWEAEDNYGYSRMIKLSGVLGYQTETSPAARSNRDAAATYEIANWISFWIRPTSGVNITWLTFPQGEMYLPHWGTMYGAHQWWNNVTFDYENRSIVFDKITGSGSVAFNETINGAKRDGISYSNFSGATLSTTSGSHSYVVYFKEALVYNINTGLGYVTIQKAINAPETLDGHTILVDAGTYSEHVVVNKSISLVGEDKSTTIIDGNGTGNVVFVEGVDGVTVTGFTVRNGINGFCLFGFNHTVVGNTMSDNTDHGIDLVGGNNCISENSITDNGVGVILGGSSYNIVSQNTVTNNQGGINLCEDCEYNGISENTLINNTMGIGLAGNNNSVVGNTIKENWSAIEVNGTSNTIYHNNFVNNTNQVCDHGTNSSDIWDNGCEGNYWSNYNGTDYNGDGIGDEYLPWEGVDYYPLMSPYIKGDVNHDAIVDIVDLTIVSLALWSQPGDPKWNPHADLNGDYIIDIVDLTICSIHLWETW